MKSKFELKKQLFNQCSDFIEHRLLAIKNTITDIQESLDSETKSSAGDKHETGRAMLQLEREKLGQQLAEIQKLKQELLKVNIETVSKKIFLGSLVYTSKHNYFMAISAGELTYKSEKFYAISFSTPIAKVLLTKEVGDHIEFGNSTFAITKIV
ncbi:3-oxoacyl-ACP synthase [Gaetbulibacter aquiaggeris]|uniref:3-oxoacyl-ACP synthase n=1 Tax=Gaetbulibacter aquiaggeris TaxID=1735373 RepID=A0ABW7MKK6_9FLAO